MRLRLIIRDTEYRQAMIAVISDADKDIYAEISDDIYDSNIMANTIIITDVPVENVDSAFLKANRERIVFLTSDQKDRLHRDDECRIHRLFKYNSISSILADVSQINYWWTGESTASTGTARIYAVISDDAEISRSVSQALARQIMFRHGSELMVLSLSYLNEYAALDEKDRSKFARLMYYMDIGREYSIDGFTYSDSYGTKYLRLPRGLNPLAYFDGKTLDRFVTEMCQKHFETVILDIATTYSSANIRVLNKADNIIFVRTEENKLDPGELTEKEEILRRMSVLPVGESNGIELRLDDYVKKIYGVEDVYGSDDEEGNSFEIQHADKRAYERSKKMADRKR